MAELQALRAENAALTAENAEQEATICDLAGALSSTIELYDRRARCALANVASLTRFSSDGAMQRDLHAQRVELRSRREKIECVLLTLAGHSLTLAGSSRSA